MRSGATRSEIQNVVDKVESMGYQTHLSQGEERTIIGVIGGDRTLVPENMEMIPGVERVLPILQPFKLASRDFHPEDTVISLNGVKIGGDEVVMMAGPCSVEGREQIMETAHVVKEAGGKVLRGGAYKPRTSPYSFQGMGLKGLEMLREAADTYGLLVVTEVMSSEKVPLVAEYADILQIGARNMQNYSLLHAVGQSGRPVLLKRSMSATLKDLLMAAEYILSHDNYRVMLCERGIRTFEDYTRNTFDVNAIPALKTLTHLPVIADPSHGTGKWELVSPVAKAAIAAGADGLLVEVHPQPEVALSDGAQSLRPERFAQMMQELRSVAEAVGRRM
jgi:3-deoxy-7-phosphoheptulonate synthase